MNGAETDYQRAYRRATEAVDKAVASGLITIPNPMERDEAEPRLKVAEFFMVALGTNVP